MKSLPLILLNFKTYPEALGKEELALAKKIARFKTDRYQIVIAPTLPLLKEVVENVTISVFAQHADPVESGAHTGSISVKELKNIGGQGTLLNHSEKKVPFFLLKKTIILCRQYHLTTVVCASSLTEVKKIAPFKPDYIAYEPTELIGGNISVTKAKPEIIAQAVRASSVPVLCGAGIQGRDDIMKALELGAKGVLIGHAVARAKNPKKFLEGMLG